MERFIEKNPHEKFDVIVIGGGISGASVAYEAATRGLKVALLEKKDFSWATSAATSKMIHGGLRYLVNGEVRLVRESLRERRVLENIAPNYVYPQPIMMMHHKKPLKNNKRVVKVGMLLYDALSYDKNRTWDPCKRIPAHKTISRREVLRQEPHVRAEGLAGASVFCDCMSIFPERLTLAFIKSAVAHGAKAANYAKVEGFLMDAGNRVAGVKVKDLLTGEVHDIAGTVTVNCGGPWADLLLDMAKPDGKDAPMLRRSEGIHIITAKRLLSGQYIVGSMTPSGRHFFLIPWRNHTLIGTTDKPFNGNPDDYRVTRESIMELIDDVNRSFGDGKLSYEDVKHTYGGLRPLVEKETRETYTSSRKYEIYDNKDAGLDGLITVEGGKYTTSRRLAENCLKIVAVKLGRNLGKSVTNKKFLTGCEIKDLNFFMNEARAQDNGLSPATLEYLARNYGTEYREIAKLAREDQSLSETLNNDGEIQAQVVYAVRNEMARTLSDIVMRRTGIGTLGNPGEEVLRKVADVAARELRWDKEKTEKEIAAVVHLLKIPVD
ncbi:MAG TPA: glycerol-3-phosphate dehydrogenase/oxidase [Smithellaceae bacterium]|jgi:glycerol-3-phosphate dehydrogenase|nr:glycerol-3-phosphate dehydrogenase/oxidase [Smithellaceae bacterium]HOE23241.1 glycerol-3-phosphate dehydrogenase/oxidase [Smithellaceae bacterium]HOR62637.1 glycerol-3-phosphate dehydrogenase/oxidase [Smithellaceae bacterium]HPL32211.1 glycerol-3-phosphate dehydrogenase/oxidase [Smithellaceae bacterium]HQH00642.1 glycerol-3-phosphate dehydrogenase/oxidase [Smithellaceae bacterium]